MLAGVRLTEFHERVALHFGAAYGSSVLLDHVLTGFDGRSAAQAIEDGVEPATSGGHCAPTSTFPTIGGEVAHSSKRAIAALASGGYPVEQAAAATPKGQDSGPVSTPDPARLAVLSRSSVIPDQPRTQVGPHRRQGVRRADERGRDVATRGVSHLNRTGVRLLW
ncbi:conserved hypothetical protein [Mycobacterium tuberculosis CPHL_A]|nr:conserved hypothetical protein [Mycobacterium tuberculosis CPHL_A]